MFKVGDIVLVHRKDRPAVLGIIEQLDIGFNYGPIFAIRTIDLHRAIGWWSEHDLSCPDKPNDIMKDLCSK